MTEILNVLELPRATRSLWTPRGHVDPLPRSCSSVCPLPSKLIVDPAAQRPFSHKLVPSVRRDPAGFPHRVRTGGVVRTRHITVRARQTISHLFDPRDFFFLAPVAIFLPPFFFCCASKKKKPPMGVDEILEARFRHILEQDQWIPKFSATPSEPRPAVLLSGGGDDSKKWFGCLLITASAVGLLAMWCRR